MKLFVIDSSLVLFFILLAVISAFGQTRCKCRPSPPGGVTTCDKRDIAVCGVDDAGVCEGRCVRIVANRTMDRRWGYTTDLLQEILGVDVRKRIREEPRIFKRIIDEVILSSERDEPAQFVFDNKQFTVSLGVPEDKLPWLKDVSKRLATRMHD